jgi:hypothetical protein
MNAQHIRLSLLTVFAAAVSTGAIAHEDYSADTGPYHWLQHLAEAKSQPKGQLGPMRNDVEQPQSLRAPLNTKPEQPSFSPFRGLGGIGGDGG